MKTRLPTIQPLRKQSGLTLLEVAVAIAIMAIIFVLSQQAISTATDAYDVTEKHGARLEQIDRAWFWIKQDLKFIINQQMQRPFEEPLPPLKLARGEEYMLTLLRAGNPNPLAMPRSELQRVAYKFEDEVLTRVTWLDPAETDEDYAREQKILEGIEEFEMEVLPASARSKDGPWTDRWNELETLPLAVQVTMTLKDRGEMVRKFVLAEGT